MADQDYLTAWIEATYIVAGWWNTKPEEEKDDTR